MLNLYKQLKLRLNKNTKKPPKNWVENVRFTVKDTSKFPKFKYVFDAIVTAKNSNNWRDDNYWLNLFDEDVLKKFWWPTQAEKDDWLKRWQNTPTEKRLKDPTLVNHPWDFLSMIEAFQNGEYELLACEKVNEKEAQILFKIWSFPFGGTDSMKALIEAFGFSVISASTDEH